MKINVTRDNVVIDKNSIKPHENEYNITQCHFTFDDFIDSFQVKRVIFTVESTGEMYENDILDYECEIPSEVLEHEYETIKVGVYGYNIGENEELINRFSPSYDTFVVPTGSYKEGALSPEPITPSQYDIYSSKLQEGLDKVDEALEEVSHVDIDAEQLDHSASVTITNRNNEPKTVVINDGYTPVKGVDYFTTAEIEEIENTVKTDVINELDFDNTVNDIKQDIQDLNTNKASKTELEQEQSARELADTNLQGQIDAITSSKDVVDIVGTYQDLMNYDTTSLTEDDVIKVLDDSTHNDAMSYYRWSNNTWNYVGSEGPFYTKSETDSLLNTKQTTIDSTHKLSSDLVDDTNQTNKFTSTNEKNTWNAKYDKPNTGIPKSDLVASVQESLNKADTAIQDVSDKEDKSNKTTTLSSSSTDTQYPSAKCVYDSQKEQNEHIAELEMLYNAFPTVSDEDTTIQLDNTAKVKFREIDLKGNTSQVVIPEEQGTSVSNTSISISDVDTDKEHTIEMSGNTYQSNAILPSEYTQVDYIESSGSQYIDTGIKGNQDTKTEIIFEITNLNYSSNKSFFGSRISTYSKHYGITIASGDQLDTLFSGYGTNSTSSQEKLTIDTKYKIVKDKNILYLNDTRILEQPYSTFETPTNMYIFAMNQEGAKFYSSIRLFNLKIYNDNTIIRDFIPCYRNSDNEVGLYDLVNNVFYTNQGTGAFTYGNVVSMPNPDYPQNIEVVTGTQNVEVCGKNLFNANGTYYKRGNYGDITISDSSIKVQNTHASGNQFVWWNIPVDTNKTITISYDSLVETSENANNAVYYMFSSTLYTEFTSFADFTKINKINKYATETTTNQYLVLAIRVIPESANTLTKPQVEYNNSASAYEQYQGTTYPVNLGNIELCKIDTYQDRIYKQNDKWYLEKNIGNVVLSQLTWVQETSANSRRYSTTGIQNSVVKPTSNSIIINMLCNIYIKNYATWTWNTISGKGIAVQKNGQLIIFDEDYTNSNDLTNFTTMLGNKNAVLYYPLATPTTTEITDTTLIGQLNALYNATIYPITNINTDTSNLLPYIDLHYNFVTPSPSPSRPSVVNVVKGNNTITISNSDNTESQNYPINLGDIELCKIGTYQDYIYESNGNWFKKNNVKVATDIIGSTSKTISDMVSNATVYSYCGGTVSGTTITYSSELLVANTIYYPTTTPTDTQITDTTLITQLNNIKKAYSYDTQTNISQTNTDKPFIIYAEAIRSLKDVFE